MRWVFGLIFSLLPLGPVCGESFSTPNFIASCPEAGVAEKVARAAEYFRKSLAVEWTGRELPKWSRPCPIQVSVGSMGASGSTTFTFEGGEVHSWDMRVRGSLERILDSVVPHEVCHTIFASKFRRPLPRWADEGAATLVEHQSERLRQVDHLNRVFGIHRQIPLKQLFEIREYPANPEDLYTLYAEGYSLAEFLVQKSGDTGKQAYLGFLKDALAQGWDAAIRDHYGYGSINELEQEWSRWVLAGSPRQSRGADLAVARETEIDPAQETVPSVERDRSRRSLAKSSRGSAAESMVIRSQTPSYIAPLALVTRSLKRDANATLEAPAPVRKTSPDVVPNVLPDVPVRLRLPGKRGR